MEIQQSLSRFLSGYTLLVNQINHIPKELIYFKPAPNNWSVCEIINHIADSEAHGYVMAKKIISECGSRVCVYNQQIWADRLFYNKMDYKDAMDIIRVLRKSLYGVLKLIAPDAWNFYIFHPDSGKITLLNWIMIYIDHIDIHIRQIQYNIDIWNKLKDEELAR